MFSHPGDKGFSSLSNKKLPKDDLVFEAIGTLDELNALLGLARVIMEENPGDIVQIQEDLGKIMAEVACFGEEKLSAGNLEFLEHITAEYEKKAGRINKFLTPGWNKKEAIVSVARAVCRRAERRVVALSHQQKVSSLILAYLNRLSLLLFYWAVILSK